MPSLGNLRGRSFVVFSAASRSCLLHVLVATTATETKGKGNIQ
jgi:hypothetical protein